jgi:large subunit ribosomal protein L21
LIDIQVGAMYAIIQDSGRQYRVTEGQELDVDFRDVEPGEELTFDRVLALGDDQGLRTGRPLLDGASVTATVVGARLGEKLYVQKLRRRKTYRRRTGHRQIFTKVKIVKIGS